VRQPFEAWSRTVRGGRAWQDSVVAPSRSVGAGWEMELTAGVHLTERERRVRTYFYRDAIDTRARWASEEGFGLLGKGGRRGWLGHRPSGPIRLAGPKARNE
jgi:hypothetical protein